MIVHLIDGTYELFRHFYGLRQGRLSSLVAKMPTPKACVKRSASRGLTRAKGFASRHGEFVLRRTRGRTRTWKKWLLILLVALLLIPAMQVAVLRSSA